MQQLSPKKRVLRESAIFAAMLFLGIVVLPIVVFKVGQLVFGTYEGHGYADFFSALSGKLGSGNLSAWFLVLSPWLGLQFLRLARLAWRSTTPAV